MFTFHWNNFHLIFLNKNLILSHIYLRLSGLYGSDRLPHVLKHYRKYDFYQPNKPKMVKIHDRIGLDAFSSFISKKLLSMFTAFIQTTKSQNSCLGFTVQSLKQCSYIILQWGSMLLKIVIRFFGCIDTVAGYWLFQIMT